jgi:hypothetical protein
VLPLSSKSRFSGFKSLWLKKNFVTFYKETFKNYEKALFDFFGDLLDGLILLKFLKTFFIQLFRRSTHATLLEIDIFSKKGNEKDL